MYAVLPFIFFLLPSLVKFFARELSIARDYRPGFYSRQEQEIFLFSIISRPVLVPNHPNIQWELEAVFAGIKRLVREADHSPPSTAECKNCGAVPPFPHTFSWRV
jgi:hypothetical protein